ncbi:4949_t:CDS:2, partial [Cetraspora pellucida]
SILYKQLEKIAKEQFLKYQSHVELLDDSENSSPLEQIDEILKLPMTSDEVLMSNIKQNDDSWINVDPKQLDALLNATNKSYEENPSESDDELNPIDLTNMIDTFEKFFDFESGVEGAEFPGEHISDEDDDIYMDGDADVKVDPTEFLRIMRQTLGISEQEYRELANEKIRQESDQITRELMDQSKSISSQQLSSLDISESSRGKMKESNDDIDMDTYMRALDAELSSSKIFGSFKAQEGLPGPVGNIFGRMGI